MIRLDSVSKQHGRQILFLEASMGAFAGDRIGLVGPNGAGKSTVFRMIVGEEPPDSGNIVVEKGVTIGYFSQSVGEMSGRSVVAETVAGAGEVSVVGEELAQLENAMADPDRMDELDALVDRFGHVQARYDELGGYSLEARAREVLAGLGFRQEVMDGPVDALSGGWKMRVALARILLMRPKALLLDEPTNHLDIESIIWLESYLRAFEGALVLTSHDRAFLNGLVTKIVDIDGGELTTYTGNYDFYEQQRAIQDVQQEAQFARQQARLAKEQAFIDRFKARASHAAQVQSRVKKLEKIELVEPPRRSARTRFEFKKPPRGGDDVIRVDHISKGYGDRPIYSDFDFLVRRTERWCVMGVNGAGKSTLLKLMAGHGKPDKGEIVLGASIKMGYFAQHAMETLDPNDTVVESLQRPFPTASLGQLRNLAGAFGFSGDEGDKPCRVLSGGEKARVALARMLYDPPNLLILDEPTNHLDMGTKEMLVESLRDFDGTMVFVSHDRAFLSALSNRVLELTDEGPRVYTGGYDEYVAQSGHAAPGLR
ncbi:MAG: ABC-F family ATP-binding cassette domain-containing protein [Sandaracinaceae bacterium]|nr:ABC-F family ATP-binding cassette domain-containing protein [Sandaracinaceae bacterium]MBK7777383.1 ABC-F family ATP-binding cassette domain-containing protein [Sandaracinaceae bacterium]MBK8408626.1 ABC-F family ATP-binding cassette domain-containing protein [Sandaracinaceae bacterium]MBK8593447.1 ABC-F family ATP-binding cassette domain-containing protein [Sandaracinaceae bacterium]MBP7680844.1 ABC-F family ATP-binding cassette domain-containing protein [Deltaproteobacteria bacterium]